MVENRSLESTWVAWVVRDGRPKSVPGHQNMETLPALPDGADDCGENNQCFYYKCRKCIYELTNDILGITKTESKLVFVPEVKFLRPKEKKDKKSALFEMDPGYHGEVAEVVCGYLSRMENLTGIAINGWSSKDAAKIFTDVDKTFMVTRDEGSKDFEIDWLIFSGNTLFVFEVGMRDYDKLNEDKGTEKLIHTKCSQVAKDAIVVRHLMEATHFTPVEVYFVAVFPNLPFENVEKKMRVRDQRESLNRLITSEKFPSGVKLHFGVITSDVIPAKSIYLYKNDEDPIPQQSNYFEEPTSFQNLLRPNACESPKYAIAVVAATKLLTTPPADNGNNGKKKKTKAEEINLNPPSSWEWTDNWQKSAGKKSVLYPIKNAPTNKKGEIIKYPEELILGPEQIQAINSKKNHTIIIGEAGSGKTTVLLAVLYKYAGKHIKEKHRLKKENRIKQGQKIKANQKNEGLKKVHFLIPETKTDLRRDVEFFVEKYCSQTWVQLGSYDIIKRLSFCSENIYLIDEFYVKDLNFNVLPSWAKIWLVHTSFDSDRASDPIIYPATESEVFYFRRLYRSPPMISKVYAKLSRQLDQNSGDSEYGGFSRIPWAMSRYDRIGFTSENSLEIETYDEEIKIPKNKLEEEYIEKEKEKSGNKKRETLIVCWRVNNKLQRQLKDQQSDAIFYSLKSTSITVHDLNFTGGEFDSVILVLGETVDTNSKAGLTLLYHTISRTKEKAYVYCHSKNFDQVKALLKLSNTDVTFDKQRAGDNFGKRLLADTNSRLLPNTPDRIEAFKRACIIGDTVQSNAIIDFSSELKNIDPVIETLIRGQTNDTESKKFRGTSNSEENVGTRVDSKNVNKSDQNTSVTKTDIKGTPQVSDDKNEAPGQVDKSKKTGSPSNNGNNDLLQVFEPKNKGFFRIFNLVSTVLAKNPEEKSLLLQSTAASTIQQFGDSFETGILRVENIAKLREQVPKNGEARPQLADFFPLVQMLLREMQDAIGNEDMASLVEIASSMVVGNDVKDDWNNLFRSLVEKHFTDEPSKESWCKYFSRLHGWIKDLLRLDSAGNPNAKNGEKGAKLMAAIGCINDQNTLIEVLKKTEIDVEDELFTLILMMIFLTKNHEVFGEWLKHLCREHSMINLINGELLKYNKTSLLTLCTRSTEHFKKVCELYDGEERGRLFVEKDIGGHNCFTNACIHDNFEVVQMLIKEYHWMPSRDLDGDTVINILAQEGNLRILKYLLSVSSDTSEEHRNLALESSRILNKKGWSFLSQICSKGHYRILNYFMKGEEKSLMQQIFPFANYSRHYIDCLILSLTSDKQSNLVYNRLLSFVEEKITDSQINLHYSPLISSDGQNILMASVNCSDTLMSLLQIAEAQSNKSGLLSQKDSIGNNCLRWACLYGSLDSVKLLLDYDQTDWKSDTYHNGKTLLHDLFDLGLFHILEYIYFKFNPDFLDLVKRLDGCGHSCLYYACSAAKSIECITLLVEVLDIILPLQIPENVSHFMACLMAAKKSKSDNKDEILEVLVQCFNEKTSTRCGDWEDVCRVYREKTADLDMD